MNKLGMTREEFKRLSAHCVEYVKKYGEPVCVRHGKRSHRSELLSELRRQVIARRDEVDADNDTYDTWFGGHWTAMESVLAMIDKLDQQRDDG